MAVEQDSAGRAKRILFFVISGCMALSLVLLVVVFSGVRSSHPARAKLSDRGAKDARPSDTAVFASYGKSLSCRACHATEYLQWAASHHGLAERAVQESIDRAAFDPARVITHGTQTSETRVRGTELELVTAGIGGKQEAFAVERAIGVDPLRQFLIATFGGRFQSTELAFDPRQGNWFDVYGGEDRHPGEWGHWTGRGMTWNSMCAACHNTRLRKNYEADSDSYRTAMAEMGVGCEACHGPMAAHNTWQQEHRNKKGDPAIKLLSRDQMLDTCGSCHSRRAELTGDFTPGESFFDHYTLVIPDETETFYPDGQIHEEDYEFTSFLGSKMHAAGVRCVDCHDPHSGKTRLPGNALCLTCHAAPILPAPKIDPVSHSHHQAGQSGNDCVECHMPQTTYMQRHARHDHGFTIPDPLLTKELGVPNACARCHPQRSTDWLIEQVDRWYGPKMERPSRSRARMVARARRREPNLETSLAQLLANETNSLWRASIASLLKSYLGTPKTTQALAAASEAAHPLVRAASLRSLEPLSEIDPAVRTIMERHLADHLRNVRVEAAWTLRTTISTNSGAGLELMEELAHNSDQPAGALQMGVFCLDRGDLGESLSWLARAVAWDTNSAPLHHEFAIALSKTGKPEEAVRELQTACALAPREAEYRFKLGLALSETGRTGEARAALEEAVKLDPQFARAWYNLGLACSAAGDSESALNALLRAESIDPTSAMPPYARATILARLGRAVEARVALRRALELQPDFSEARSLLESLEQ